MKTTRLYLIRHGQVMNHHEFRYNGHFDVDITDIGVLQMENIAAFLSKEPITAVYSSDLQRATKGAEIIGGTLGLKPVKVHAFRELHLGRWEGLTREEGAAQFPEEADFRFRDLANTRIKGGENLHDLKNRVVPALKGTLTKHAGEHIALIAHGGVNRVILCDAMGLPMGNFFRIEQDYGCLNVIDYFDDGVKVVKLLNGGPNQELNIAKIY
ncbi:MAG: histidine phosphatase family protein [Deltaproteobacteria bacterium]|nr:histidine phosphatase family protein [Deltaproteobacteria bacterium]